MTGVSTSLAIIVAWVGFRKYVSLYLSVQAPNSEQIGLPGYERWGFPATTPALGSHPKPGSLYPFVNEVWVDGRDHELRSMTPLFRGLLHTNPRGSRLMSATCHGLSEGNQKDRDLWGCFYTVRPIQFNCSSIPVHGLSHSVFVRTGESETHSGSYITSGDDV